MYRLLMIAVAPALRSWGQAGFPNKGHRSTHRRPRLMASITPIFSGMRICRFQRIFQGSRASEISTKAAHTGMCCQQGTPREETWTAGALLA